MSERERKPAEELRRQAEARLSRLGEADQALDERDARRLLHELRIHQIELEMQNDELRASRLETETLLARYTELFEFAPIGFFHLGPDGAIRESNFAGARLLGVERGKLRGRSFAALVTAPERRAFGAFLAAVLTRGAEDAATETGEFSIWVPDGERRTRISGALLEGGAEPTALLAVEDVTARRHAEEALREESRRKDDFLAALSHELRNPLAPIRNALVLLARLPPGGDKARAALDIIDRQVGHLTRVVDDLLDVTRIARGKVRLQLARLELGALVRGTIEDHRPGFEGRRVRLGCETGAGPSWVEGDASRLVQVLGNLLGNALKFTNPGGEVRVSLRSEAGSAVLSVQDSGVGIAPEIAAHLFEPFSQGPQTLDRSRGGLGLGLATVRGLVELHGGEVSAESVGPGRGATFTVRLPLAVAPPEVSAGAAPAVPHPRRVLVIEDNPDAAESLRQLLELDGHEVRVAGDGPAGIFLAREFRPDVVLCDIGLPGMSGYDVARALRAEPQLGGVRLVALSCYAQAEDLRHCSASGFDGHLTKPASHDAIERVIAGTASSPG